MHLSRNKKSIVDFSTEKSWCTKFGVDRAKTLSYCPETKCDGQTNGFMDGRTQGRTHTHPYRWEGEGQGIKAVS